ncbi:MAG: DUF4190 domain-containing protein [Candidatus Dormibacteraeota bacterium]|nr:DUF4190 domain-containing protein [Candidatus Dormibacteraeota bacterium]
MSDLPPPPPSETPPPAPSPASPTQVVGQQIVPSTAVPLGDASASIAVGGRKTNSLAVVSLVTALAAPFGHIIGVGGITLIVISLVTGHMARAQIKKTGEDGATLAMIGLVISYIHLVVTILLVIFLFGLIVAFFGALIHAGTSGG